MSNKWSWDLFFNDSSTPWGPGWIPIIKILTNAAHTTVWLEPSWSTCQVAREEKPPSGVVLWMKHLLMKLMMMWREECPTPVGWIRDKVRAAWTTWSWVSTETQPLPVLSLSWIRNSSQKRRKKIPKRPAMDKRTMPISTIDQMELSADLRWWKRSRENQETDLWERFVRTKTVLTTNGCIKVKISQPQTLWITGRKDYRGNQNWSWTLKNYQKFLSEFLVESALQNPAFVVRHFLTPDSPSLPSSRPIAPPRFPGTSTVPPPGPCPPPTP